MLQVRVLRQTELAERLPDVAQLRISVFRDWPYLYDGDATYEERYLQPYLQSEDAIVVGAFDGDALVGASTGTPLTDHADDFGAAFARADLELASVFYCAESVLLPAYRGQGIGHAFFDAREAHAREKGFTACAFCGVLRGEDHPLRPSTYRPLDAFWRSRGYVPLDGVVAQFSWKELGEAQETPKPLQFWIRML